MVTIHSLQHKKRKLFQKAKKKRKGYSSQIKAAILKYFKTKTGDEDHSLSVFVENEKKIQINALQMANSWKI